MSLVDHSKHKYQVVGNVTKNAAEITQLHLRRKIWIFATLLNCQLAFYIVAQILYPYSVLYLKGLEQVGAKLKIVFKGIGAKYFFAKLDIISCHCFLKELFSVCKNIFFDTWNYLKSFIFSIDNKTNFKRPFCGILWL